MPLATTLFSYDLPPDRIAQSPASPRDSSRLLAMDRHTGELAHHIFRDLPDLLRPGDVLVRNVTKVFPARILLEGGEVFLLSIADGEVRALLRPGKKYRVGAKILVAGDEPLTLSVMHKEEDGVATLATGMTAAELFAWCARFGEIPLPPYIHATPIAQEYQTTYAQTIGSVAAPTAGLHFTPELFARLEARGVQIEDITLHVGIGTFRPMVTDTIEEHRMHGEWAEVTAEVADRLNAAHREGRRIIAIGTTTTRVLEGIAFPLRPWQGEINCFITPGFSFRVISGLITNFHLPKSTLLVLVSAFAGREQVLAAYEEAKQQGYRFFSYGDAMLITDWE